MREKCEAKTREKPVCCKEMSRHKELLVEFGAASSLFVLQLPVPDVKSSTVVVFAALAAHTTTAVGPRPKGSGKHGENTSPPLAQSY